eukprot:352093_1
MAEQNAKSSKDVANGPNPSSDQLKEFFGSMQPIIEKLIDVYAQLAPYIDIAKVYVNQGWETVQPYYNQYWSPAFIEIFIGFTLLFYGGIFAMSIACYMAVQLSGWDTIKRSWTILKRNYSEGMDAFEKDPNAKKFFDKDGDGQVSAQEIGSATKVLFTGTADQKQAVLLNLRCVFVAVDPQEVMKGVGGLWTTAIAVIATLRSGFAKDIALGVSLGEIGSKQISKYAKPMIAKRFDDDMKKWADFLIDAVCRAFGVSLALILMRVVSSFHSAVKGGQIIARHVFKFMTNKQLYTAQQADAINAEGTTVFMVLQYGLAAMGWYWQLSSGFTLNSWILRLILLPFSFCELILTWLAAY